MKCPALLLIFTVALLSGCASTAPRTVALQTRATGVAATAPQTAKEVKIAVTDSRADRALDAILTKPARDEVVDALRIALRDSKALSVREEATAAWEINGTLVRLEWFVPGYKAMIKKAFAASFLTGGLGGLAYGSTSTRVEGHATVRLSVLCAGREVFAREYAGRHEENTAKLKCDTMETRARVAGLALSDAIDKFLKDLDQSAPALATPVAAAH